MRPNRPLQAHMRVLANVCRITVDAHEKRTGKSPGDAAYFFLTILASQFITSPEAAALVMRAALLEGDAREAATMRERCALAPAGAA